MSVPDLSDDMAGWPTDPFALLGVSPGAADADVKRAYTRLVRRFKPEHHPDQFRRIREAYEACMERAAWYRPEPVSPPPPPPPPPRRPTPVRPQEREPVIDRPVAPAPELEPVVDPAVTPAPPLDPVEEWWEAAITGRETEAYHELVRLAGHTSQDPTVSLRLYWLLALNPALDPVRTRHHWLAEALALSELRGPAAELYRRELDADPAGALDHPFDPGPYSAVLSASAAPNDVQAVARWRIAAAGRLKWSARTLADLTRLRDFLPMADESGWLGLLVLAGGWAAWAGSLELRDFLKAEVRGLTHLQLSHAPLFDRLEESEWVWKGVDWERHEGTLTAFLQLVHVSWADAGYARPAEVEAAATDVGQPPYAALSKLDNPFAQQPQVLALAAREFDHYLRSRGLLATPDFPPDRLRGLARRLRAHRLSSYQRARMQLLDLLVADAVHPLEFAAALAEDRESYLRGFAAALRDDLSLQVAWLASRVLSG